MSAGSYPDTSEAGRNPERTERPESPQNPDGAEQVHGEDLGQLAQQRDLQSTYLHQAYASMQHVIPRGAGPGWAGPGRAGRGQATTQTHKNTHGEDCHGLVE